MRIGDRRKNMFELAEHGTGGISDALWKTILDDCGQMVLVSDLDTMQMLYANEPACRYAVNAGEPYAGKACYRYMRGLDEPCPYCPLRELGDADAAETEVDNGKEIFAVKTRIIRRNGKKYFIEYARDITDQRRSQEIFSSQLHMLIDSVSDAQGLFHFDLTENRCLHMESAEGSCEALKALSADEILRHMFSYVRDEKRRAELTKLFSCASLREIYGSGRVEITEEADSVLPDGTVQSSRATARLMANPTTNHLECVLFCFDITAEREEKARREKYIREQFDILNALGRDYLGICLLNLKTETVQMLKYTDPKDAKNHAVLMKESSYRDEVRKYVGMMIEGSRQAEILENVSPEHVTKMLAEKPEYSFTFEAFSYGERHDCQMKFLRLSDSEHIVMAFRFIDDIVAAEKEHQNALAKAMAATEQAYIAAEHANQAKTTFLNSMSHDIRTPMNAILGFTALASTHVDQPEIITDYLGKIMSSSNHLLNLINDVLDMSRIESGRIKIEERECSLSTVLHDLRNMLQADIRDKQLDLFIDTVDVIHEHVICDRLRLNQILINILSNAIKFTNPGGAVSLRVIEKENAPEDYADFDFVVRDNGIGMSKEFAEHIFEPFSREENSMVSSIPGTGLGMAITKNLVDMMNGKISVQSELGEGSTFTVSMRFLLGKQTSGRRGIKNLEGFRALVADDSADACISTSKMLKVIGMRPDWTTAGKEAVIRAKAAAEENDEYKVYIIDWLIPDMNGVEVVRRIRREVGTDAAIIILTAYDWSDIEKEAREAGVTAFCAKPLFLSELYSVLQDASEVPEKAESAEPIVDPEEFKGKRILLVDDVELNREIAEAILDEAGMEVESATNGLEAVRMMENAEAGYFDLILMDVMMPQMDGLEATRHIRRMEDARKANIPIIAMTANAFEEDRAAALAAGMNEHLAKPFRIEALYDIMRRFIKKDER